MNAKIVIMGSDQEGVFLERKRGPDTFLEKKESEDLFLGVGYFCCRVGRCIKV